MKQNEIDFIKDCLPTGRTKFYTHQHHYLFQTLAWKLGARALRVHELKKSPDLKRYMQQPTIREFIGNHSNDTVTTQSLETHWQLSRRIFPFRLTLDQWGMESPNTWQRDWAQTSRSGMNLVLQLNFPDHHNRSFRNLSTEERSIWRYAYNGHPVRVGNENTMSWARIDLELDHGCALIEEVQNDWLRKAYRSHLRLRNKLEAGEVSTKDLWHESTIQRQLDYDEQHIAPLTKLWAEATLLAAMQFLINEIGIKNIFYHTWASGVFYKKISRNHGPPKSLYEDLPRRFGFNRVSMGPPFIVHNARVQRKHGKRPKSAEHDWWKFTVC